MESYLLKGIEADADSLVVEGYHKPGSLTRATGAWIYAGRERHAEPGAYELVPRRARIWLAVEEGEAELTWRAAC